MGKKWVVVISIFIFILLIYILKFYDRRSPSLFLIPQNYNGWVRIIYNQQGNDELKKEGKYNLIKVGTTGVLKTATKDMLYGWADDKYFFYNEKGDRFPIDSSVMIHGSSNGNKEEISTKNPGETKKFPTIQIFFVGTESEFVNSRKSDYPNDIMSTYK